MEVSRIEQIEEHQKWQQAYQSLALSVENRDSGVVSGFSSPISNPPSSRDPEMRDSGIRELNSGEDANSEEYVTMQVKQNFIWKFLEAQFLIYVFLFLLF